MGLLFSPVTFATESCCSGNCAALKLDRAALAGFVEPVLRFIEFRMSGPTFAPEPLAGFAAVTCVLEDSAGSLRNRDSLGGDRVTSPGGILWTQAGSGIIHDGLPAEVGREVHGVHVFINSSRSHKLAPPRVYRADSAAVPMVQDDRGNRARILAGRHAVVAGPITPPEPFDFLDVRLTGPWHHGLPGRRNTLLYVIEGEVRVHGDGSTRTVATRGAVGIRADDTGGELALDGDAGAHVLVLSGTDPGEPVAEYGTFIMNTEAEVNAAYERYRDGGMGRLNVSPSTDYLSAAGDPGANGRAGAH